MAGTQSAESSSAAGIENLTAEERQTWRMTGELPERKPAKPSEEPTPEEQAAAKAAEKPLEESAPSSETPETEESERTLESEPSAPRKPERKLSPAEKRIKQLLADRKSLEARVQELEKNATTPRNGQPEAAAKPKAEEKAAEGTRARPTPNDKKPDGSLKYGTYEEFAEDLADWKVEQRFAERDKAESERRVQAEQEQKQRAITQGWQEKVVKAREKHADYDEVALNPDLPIKPGSVVDVMTLESPHGTDLLYFLGQNPEELDRINALPPIQAARELFRIETSHSGNGNTPRPRKVTQAPPPAREVGGRGSAPADDVTAAVNKGDFASYRNAANRREIALRKG